MPAFYTLQQRMTSFEQAQRFYIAKLLIASGSQAYRQRHNVKRRKAYAGSSVNNGRFAEHIGMRNVAYTETERK